MAEQLRDRRVEDQAQERKHHRAMTAILVAETEDDSFGYLSEKIDLDHDKLTQLANRKRSGKEDLEGGHIAYVKLFTKDTSIKLTQWNSWCVRIAWIHRKADDTWHKEGDRQDIKTQHHLGEIMTMRSSLCIQKTMSNLRDG